MACRRSAGPELKAYLGCDRTRLCRHVVELRPDRCSGSGWVSGSTPAGDGLIFRTDQVASFLTGVERVVIGDVVSVEDELLSLDVSEIVFSAGGGYSGGYVGLPAPESELLDATADPARIDGIESGQRLMLLLRSNSLEQGLPGWHIKLAFDAFTLELLGKTCPITGGDDWFLVDEDLQRLFLPEEDTVDEKALALVDAIEEAVAASDAARLGLEPPPTPRLDLVYPPTTLPDPLAIWEATPFELRSLDPVDVPPGVDFELVAFDFVLRLDPGLAGQFNSLRFENKEGYVPGWVIESFRGDWPMSSHTVVGEDLVVVLYREDGSFSKMGSIPPSIVEGGPFLLEVSFGGVKTTPTTAEAWQWLGNNAGSTLDQFDG